MDEVKETGWHDVSRSKPSLYEIEREKAIWDAMFGDNESRKSKTKRTGE
jgi:hypothetical protein